MATYRGSLILSPSVDIRPHLPPVSYLQQGINFQYRNDANIDPTKPNLLELYLLDSKGYPWWDHAPNVYFPVYSRRPVFTQGQSAPTARKNLLFQISTVKAWIEEYNRTIDIYTDELSRIARLEAYYRKAYNVVVRNPSTGVNETWLLRTLYQSYIDAHETDLLRLIAIQYEVEQRLVFFDTNNALPTSILTPEFTNYYTTLNYNLFSYNGQPSPGLTSTIFRSATPQNRPTWHHLTPPETVTGNPFWGTDVSDIRTYNKTNNLILGMTLRTGSSIIGFDDYRYHQFNYYQDIPGRTAGRVIAEYLPNLGMTDIYNDGYRWYQWKESGIGIKTNQNREVADTVCLINEKLDKFHQQPFNSNIGDNPVNLKSVDSAHRQIGDNFITPFLSAPSQINFPAGNLSEYPVDNLSWYRGEEVTYQIYDEHRGVKINRWAQGAKPWYEYQGTFNTTSLNAFVGTYLPGSQNIELLPESIHKVIDKDTDDVYFKRSATIEYPVTTVTGYYVLLPSTVVRYYTLTVKAKTPYIPVKVWYGGDAVKPTLPQVWFDIDYYTPAFPLGLADSYLDFKTIDNGPAWLMPNNPTLSIRKTFLSNTLTEEYLFIWRYDDIDFIPREQEIILYTVTYDLTPE